MKQHTTQSAHDTTPEQLDDAVERLRAGKRPGMAQKDALRAAAQLHVLTSDDSLDQEIDDKTAHLLLQRFGVHSPTKKQHFLSEKKSLLQNISFGFLPAAAMGLAALAYIVVQDVRVETIAEVQGTKSLSSAEKTLGKLPAGTIRDGIDMAQLRAEIHAINAKKAATDTTLVETASIFPHVELRDSARDIISSEKEVLAEIEQQTTVAFVESDIAGFEAKVATWPTTNEGVSFEVHKNAVNAFIEHNRQWNEQMEQLIIEILQTTE